MRSERLRYEVNRKIVLTERKLRKRNSRGQMGPPCECSIYQAEKQDKVMRKE